MLPLRYIVKRVMLYLITLFVAITINFAIPRLAPGDPIQTILSRFQSYGVTSTFNSEVIDRYIHRFGLDKDILTQFTSYIKELLTGHLGLSIVYFPSTVEELIMRSLPWTVFLLSISTAVSWVIGNLLGLIVGWKRSSKIANLIGPIAWITSQLPYYIMALILVFLLAYMVELFPLGGAYSRGITLGFNLEAIMDILWHATLPMLSIIIGSTGWWLLSMRAMVLGVLGEDYVLLAEAKGLKSSYIMTKYVFKNALLPQITGLALSLGNIAGGAILAEIIFSYPGLGWLLWTAVVNLDYPLIQGIVILIIFGVCTATLIIDLIYPLIDPRIRYQEE